MHSKGICHLCYVPEALPDHELAVARELEHVEDELLELDAVVGLGLLGGAGPGVEEGDLLARDVLRQLPEVRGRRIRLPGKSNVEDISP